jgi:hypothetical protein
MDCFYAALPFCEVHVNLKCCLQTIDTFVQLNAWTSVARGLLNDMPEMLLDLELNVRVHVCLSAVQEPVCGKCKAAMHLLRRFDCSDDEALASIDEVTSM